MVHDIRRGLDFDDTVSPDDVLPFGYDNDPRPSYREQLELCRERLHQVGSQRDELLAACEAALVALKNIPPWIEGYAALGQVEAAIARCEEEVGM